MYKGNEFLGYFRGEYLSRGNRNCNGFEVGGWMVYLRNSVVEVEEGIKINLGMRLER